MPASTSTSICSETTTTVRDLTAFAALCYCERQGQYWIEYLYLLLAAPPYMAAANFVVIINGGGCALTGIADIDQ